MSTNLTPISKKEPQKDARKAHRAYLNLLESDDTDGLPRQQQQQHNRFSKHSC